MKLADAKAAFLDACQPRKAPPSTDAPSANQALIADALLASSNLAAAATALDLLSRHFPNLSVDELTPTIVRESVCMGMCV